MLARAGVRVVTSDEAHKATGYGREGLVIPYRNADGSPLVVNGRPFARLRVSDPGDGPRYLSPAKSGCQAYVPPGLDQLLVTGPDLVLVEGEFKSLALAEAGVAAIGIGGISSACPKNDKGEPELLPAIRRLIEQHRPARLLFLGDADTALIPAFAHEAVKLAKVSGLPLALPRIAADAPGKGPDDLREALGTDAFLDLWKRIVKEAEPVTAKTSPGSLAVRLLRREEVALAKLAGDEHDRAEERVAKLAASFAGDALAAAQIEKIAHESLGVEKTVFRAAVRACIEDQRRAAAEHAAAKAIEALGPDGDAPLFFDGTSYWRREADGAFGKLSREDARLHLNKLGLSKNGDPSPCDAALHDLQKNNRVGYAGPLCGRPPGLHLENGLRVLATRGPAWIAGTQGTCPTVFSLVLNLLGRAANDAHAETQVALFIAWLRLAREAVRHHDQHRPGQVLALVGPPDCGKSLLQSAVITPALGGRAADPGLFFIGQTNFNADLWGAEHLALGDKALDVDGSQRATLRNELKRVVAEAVYPLHPKNRDAQTFRPVWRVSISANSDPESASNLPALDAAFADKIIYLKCYAPPAPFYDAEAPGAREVFAKTLRDELPAFLNFVDALEIPAPLRKARFGVTEWHHPDILALLDEGDPLRPIAEAIDRWTSTWPVGEDVRELPTVDLFAALDESADGNLARHRISTGPKHLGHQLARLSLNDAWRERLTRSEWRVGGRSVNKLQRGWRISK